MGTQKINVKNTYVATVKSDIANRAISFYAKDLKNDIFVEESVFPTNPVTSDANLSLNDINANQVVNTVENNAVATPDNNVRIPEELNIDSAVNIPIASDNVTVTEEPVVPSMPEVNAVPTIPNLNVLEAVVSPMPVTPDVNVQPEPIPNPVNQPVPPTPLSDSIVNVANTAVVNNTDNNSVVPPKFDASKETNLLGVLGENQGQSSIGNINVTPENLNVVREFGVDEPIVTDQNGVPVANRAAGGFINSKILLFVVVLLFLASCVFLGYEIYSYFTLTK